MSFVYSPKWTLPPPPKKTKTMCNVIGGSRQEYPPTCKLEIQSQSGYDSYHGQELLEGSLSLNIWLWFRIILQELHPWPSTPSHITSSSLVSYQEYTACKDSTSKHKSPPILPYWGRETQQILFYRKSLNKVLENCCSQGVPAWYLWGEGQVW